MKKRASGILMHISSLPGEYGIGDFGQSAYDFVDFLVDSGQKYWQILPLGITGYGDSPYQCFSAFAGNPYFIDLKELLDAGYLKDKNIIKTDLGNDPETVDYYKLYIGKMALLKKAYHNAKKDLKEDLDDYYEENKSWLREFALYMAIKEDHNQVSWVEWDEDYKSVESDKVMEFEKKHLDTIYFWVFTQYFFSKQWTKLKDYANANEIKIIGDLPIYVAEDSSDAWARPELFKLDSSMKPVCVAGCPPDAFSATGQLWGNPIYDWDAMKDNEYAWWVERIKFSLTLFDTLRIDHFRGFEAYWEIKYGDPTAEKGKWVKGPGMDLFNQIKKELGDLDIIAEDLGFLTDDVHQLIEDTGFPGMKVLQFAFDTREESDYLPHNYPRNSIVYTGTHDNDTSVGWFENVQKSDFEYAIKYLKLNFDEGLNWGFIRGAWSSVAYLAIAPMQDFLGLDDSARMNTPSTIGGNWTWRMKKDALTDQLSSRIKELNKTYGR